MKFALINKNTGETILPDQDGDLIVGNYVVFISGSGKPYEAQQGWPDGTPVMEDISKDYEVRLI